MHTDKKIVDDNVKTLALDISRCFYCYFQNLRYLRDLREVCENNQARLNCRVVTKVSAAKLEP